MKGLLIKDLKTIMTNNRTFLLIAIAIVFITVFSNDPSFVLGYITVLCSVLVIATISYDELDNGYNFLFTLPITRTMYVRSKYVFGAIYTILAWGVACAAIGGICALRGVEFEFSFSVGIVASCYIFQAIMIPIQLKFGAEKARVALAVIFGGIFAIGAAGVVLVEKTGISIEALSRIGTGLSEVPESIIITLIFAVTIVFVVISYFISVKVMKAKEF